MGERFRRILRRRQRTEPRVVPIAHEIIPAPAVASTTRPGPASTGGHGSTVTTYAGPTTPISGRPNRIQPPGSAPVSASYSGERRERMSTISPLPSGFGSFSVTRRQVAGSTAVTPHSLPVTASGGQW